MIESYKHIKNGPPKYGLSGDYFHGPQKKDKFDSKRPLNDKPAVERIGKSVGLLATYTAAILGGAVVADSKEISKKTEKDFHGGGNHSFGVDNNVLKMVGIDIPKSAEPKVKPQKRVVFERSSHNESDKLSIYDEVKSTMGIVKNSITEGVADALKFFPRAVSAAVEDNCTIFNTADVKVEKSPDSTGFPGQQIEVNVTIDPNGSNIAGWQSNVEGQNVVLGDNVQEGDLFTRDGNISTFFNKGTLNSSLNKIINIFDAIIGPHSTNNKGTAFKLNGTSGPSGNVSFNLDNVKISDPCGQPIPVNVSNLTIERKFGTISGSVSEK